jgi:hypothetical protein
MFTLHRSKHFTIEFWQASRYVRLVRSAVPFSSPDEADEALKECELAIRDIDPSNLGILLDWRLGPLSSDPKLHQFVIENTDAFASRFVRRAVLVVTPVGMLQLDRVIRNLSSTKPVLFNDESAAVNYVTSR